MREWEWESGGDGGVWLLHVSTSILLAGSTRFPFWDIFICPKATGRINQVHIMRQHRVPQSWGSTRVTLRKSSVCTKATGRINQVHSLRQPRRQSSYWQDKLGYVLRRHCMHLNYWQEHLLLWDNIVCTEAIGRISQVHSLREHCMHQSYWQGQPGFTLWDRIVCTKATGKISQVYATRQHCFRRSYWQDQPGFSFFYKHHCIHQSYWQDQPGWHKQCDTLAVACPFYVCLTAPVWT